MTREEFDKLEFGADVVLNDSAVFGVPVSGKVFPGYYWFPDAQAKWMFVKSDRNIRIQWCPKSDAEFMDRVELKINN